MTPITPNDIAQLAETRRRDPELALKIADRSAAQYDPRNDPELEAIVPYAGKKDGNDEKN